MLTKFVVFKENFSIAVSKMNYTSADMIYMYWKVNKNDRLTKRLYVKNY